MEYRRLRSPVIIGASRVEQLVENLQSLDTVALLTDEVMEAIHQIIIG